MQIGESLTQPGRTGPEGAQLQRLELIRGLRAELVIPNERFDRRQEVLILGHENLRVEDARFLGSRTLEHTLAEVLKMRDHVVHRLTQTAHFVVDFIRADRPIGNLGEVPAHDQGWSPGDARRDADAAELPGAAHCSPNPSATSAASASAACSASGPSARMVMELPHSAANIITPMMLLPFTPTPSLQISISAVNELASRTIRAAGRACSPS